MQLLIEIPRVFSGLSETSPPATTAQTAKVDGPQSCVSLRPELRSFACSTTALDLVVAVNAVKLHLYDALTFSDLDFKDHGIAKFVLNDNTLRFKLLSDGASEAQIVLRSFTINNTRPGLTKYREIIPAAQHHRNQFMLLYSTSGGSNPTSSAVLTVDSPRVIFAIDPVISLLNFFTSAFHNTSPPPSPPESVSEGYDHSVQDGRGRTDFRVDLHEVSFSILENDVDSETRAICLYINQISLSQQVVI
jgi:vacuolar protein sorting-associated protein 13A/C